MMNRRSFFTRFAKCVAVAALATHMTFGELAPIPSVETIPLASMDKVLAELWDKYAVHPNLSQTLFVSPKRWFGLMELTGVETIERVGVRPSITLGTLNIVRDNYMADDTYLMSPMEIDPAETGFDAWPSWRRRPIRT